jgi:5-methylcytosine-specific restriction endonuclease McrA
VIARGTKPNRCKHCRERMPAELARHVLHEDCIDPWLAAQAAKKEAARLKKERAEDRVKRAAMKTIAQLIAAAQLAFNAYIRERDKDKGCFVCGRPFLDAPGRVQHAGHVRSRGAAGHLRFNEDNCMGECEGCNGPRGAKPHQIKAGAIARIGADRFDALEASNDPHKWGRDELISIRKTYQDKLKALQREGDRA